MALEAGGYLDTVVPEVTGTFFAEPTPAAIRAAVTDNRDGGWSAADIVRHADTFAEPAFHAALRAAVADLADAALRATESHLSGDAQLSRHRCAGGLPSRSATGS